MSAAPTFHVVHPMYSIVQIKEEKLACRFHWTLLTPCFDLKPPGCLPPKSKETSQAGELTTNMGSVLD